MHAEVCADGNDPGDTSERAGLGVRSVSRQSWQESDLSELTAAPGSLVLITSKYYSMFNMFKISPSRKKKNLLLP